jgi:hypothetical protein
MQSIYMRYVTFSAGITGRHVAQRDSDGWTTLCGKTVFDDDSHNRLIDYSAEKMCSICAVRSGDEKSALDRAARENRELWKTVTIGDSRLRGWKYGVFFCWDNRDVRPPCDGYNTTAEAEAAIPVIIMQRTLEVIADAIADAALDARPADRLSEQLRGVMWHKRFSKSTQRRRAVL